MHSCEHWRAQVQSRSQQPLPRHPMMLGASETERGRVRRLLDSSTEREKQCSLWAFCGMTNKEIGQEIGCATRTVKLHLSHLYARLGLRHESPFMKRAMLVKMMIDASAHQETGVEMRQLFNPRQIEVLDLVSEGLKNKEIAWRLSTTEHKVKNDLRRIFDLAGCGSRVEVVVWWINHRGCGEGRVTSKSRDARSVASAAPQVPARIPVSDFRVTALL